MRAGRRRPISIKGAQRGVRQHPRSAAPANPEGDRGRPVLLVIDDDAGVRELLRLILDDEYAVLDVRGGREGINTVCAEHVDLVLLDILMPEVDGLEVLQELQALAP